MNGLLVTPDRFTGCVEDFGYDYLAFSNLKLGTHGPYEGEMGKRELAVVVLGGSCSVESSRGEWREIGAARTSSTASHSPSTCRPTHISVSRLKRRVIWLCVTQRPKRTMRVGW